MITAEQIKHLIPQGETTTVQFKLRSEDAYKMGVEMVAFSNTQGGMLIIGVNDKTGVIKQGISVPRNQLLFDNAKYLLPYTGIGSGIMRAMKSYDKIIFKNNFDTEEFVITILRDETVEGINEGVNYGNDRVNLKNDRVNPQSDTVNLGNDRVNEIFDRVNFENDRVKNELIQIYSFIEENPLVKIASIEQLIQKSDKTVRRYLKILKDNELIEYVGSDKTGGYKVVTKL